MENISLNIASFVVPERIDRPVKGALSEKVSGPIWQQGPTANEIYQLKEGFSRNISSADLVKLSPQGRRLSQMAPTRMVLESYSKPFNPQEMAPHFDAAAIEQLRTHLRETSTASPDQIESTAVDLRLMLAKATQAQAKQAARGEQALAQEEAAQRQAIRASGDDPVFIDKQIAGSNAIVREFNTKYLDAIQTASDALLLRDQLQQRPEGMMLITNSEDERALSMKIGELQSKEYFSAHKNGMNHTLELYDRYNEFTSLLGKKDPTLEGVQFEFELDGDRLRVSGGSVNGRDLTDRDMAFIENLANSRDPAGKRLLETMHALRDDALAYYNRFTEEGRANPITKEGFGARFGGFSQYLDSFRSNSENLKFDLKSPEDVARNERTNNLDRSLYFDWAADALAARLTMSA